jgi:predicted O-methyltransferase YrrM
LAKETLDALHINNVELIEGNIDETLPVFLESMNELGFVYFDANHNKEATMSYFNLCINKATSDSVFVFDDIHYSQGMEQAWQQIIKDKRVKVSFDLFSLGIIYFKKELQKQDYIYLF